MESLSLDTIKHFLDLHEECAREFARILNKKASQEEIKAHLRSKTEQAISSSKSKLSLEKTKLNCGLTLEYTSIEKENGTTKAVKSLMKSMKISEKQAYDMVNAGLKTALAHKESKSKLD